MTKPRGIDISGVPALGKDSAEVARIWVTDRAGSTVLIDAGVLEDPRVFGYLMADTIRHAAKAYAAAWSTDEGAALQAIVDGVAEELREQFNDITPIDEGRTN
ncbi:DUF5076 domain-containing protein [Sphingomonas radiodurans]|uniref:DUF5076 domain-containing protein n=1 Tax=Sphingomonas radiodurans TaxID=2890321 RepID=UPI001E429F9D|nr:DUF5076 domain-containing protein [Sphingomonas radiodurans]WBH15411.1 DUF5076 domain-containing protein [Sphingomonas radiodurans]